jgi:hypothetical protein
MKKMRIYDLPNWPPDPGGAFLGSSRIPTSERAILTRVGPRLVDGNVTFVGEFEGNEHTYDFNATSEDLAERIREALRQNLGRSIFSLGELEIEQQASDKTAA